MVSRRRLLFITERFAPDVGGVSRSASRTVAALAQKGIDVEVLSWSRSLRAGERDRHELQMGTDSGRVVVHRMGLFANLDYSLQHSMTLLESLHGLAAFEGVWVIIFPRQDSSRYFSPIPSESLQPSVRVETTLTC